MSQKQLQSRQDFSRLSLNYEGKQVITTTETQAMAMATELAGFQVSDGILRKYLAC